MSVEFLDKGSMIRKYILDIDFKSDDWSIYKIREDIKNLIKEDPGVDITYSKDPVLNETTGKIERLEKMEKITIVFSDGSDKFQKVEFSIDSIV